VALTLLGGVPDGAAGDLRILPPAIEVPRHGVVALPAAPVVADGAGQGATVQFEGLGGDPGSPPFLPFLRRPDPTLGVGPGHVFQLVSATVGRVSDRSGTPLLTFTADDFFDFTGFHVPNSPRVIFDAPSGRWFATVVASSSTGGVLALAVSATSDPTQPFCHYRVTEAFRHGNPSLGASDDKLLVAYDGVGLPFAQPLGAGYYVLNKADLVACADTVQTTRVAPDPSLPALHAAQALTSASDLHMVTHNAGSTLAVLTVSGVPGISPVTAATTAVPVRAWLAPPNAPQAGSGVLLRTLDARVQSAAWQDQTLWLAGVEACTLQVAGPLLSCLRLIELQTDSWTVRQDLTFGSPGEYYFYPALRPDAAGNLHVVFAVSSPSRFLSVAVTRRRVGDQLNTLRPAIQIQAGTRSIPAIVPGDPVSDSVGAYFSAAVDPIDPSAVWVTGQYAGPGVTTTIAQLTLLPLPPSVAAKTFTVPPCRVLDTRLASPPGPIGGAAARNLRVVGPLGSTGQGGAADCGVPSGASGVFINVIAVGGAGPGHLTVYPASFDPPLASTLNFSTGNVANGVVVPICVPFAACGADLTIQMGPSAAHVVIDVTGYLAPP
jgi:hypothetical protein